MMIKTYNPVKDPFFEAKCNPLFAAAFNEYWTFLTEAKITQQEEGQAEAARNNLMQFAFRHIFKSLYHQHPPEMEGSTYLMACISADGLGDYFTLLKAARLLKKQHPHLDVHAVYTHLLPLPDVTPQTYHLQPENIVAFKQTTDSSSYILEAVLDNKPIAETKHNSDTIKQAKAIYKNLKESLAIVQIALAMNTFDNPDFAKKSFYFAESGNFQGIANFLQRNWFSLGVHAFEEGIFLKPTPTNDKWEDPRLKNYNPSQYRTTRHLHLGYIPKVPQQQMEFIYFLCKLHQNDNKDIEVYLPNSFLFSNLNQNKLAQLGISTIVTSDFENEHQHQIPNSKGKKTLRLIAAMPIPQGDFNKLVHLSEEIVGCTGDLSLSECLAAGKIPFYEIRIHKTNQLEALRQTAAFLSLNNVADYLASFNDAEKLFEVHARPKFQEEWDAFMRFIKKYYSFENSFLSHLNRHFWMIKKPHLAEFEQKLIQDYSNGSLNGKETFAKLERELK
jgi:hypothetical protein